MNLADATRILAESAGLDADDDAMRAIAERVDREPAALAWAGALAKTRGWRSVSERLATWSGFATLVRPGATLPWQAEAEEKIAALGDAARAMLVALAACDSPVTWEVIETALAEGASEDVLCDLVDVGLVRRDTRAGVVMFVVPFGIRSALRRDALADARALAHEAAWTDAWLARANELASTTYGPNARPALTELASAIPLAERSLLESELNAEALARALSLWVAIADAMFFEGSVDYASPAFARAVALADASPDMAARARARLAGARARLERGEAEGAETWLTEARALAASASGTAADALRSEALRGSGWAALASARLDDARVSFTSALEIAERGSDARSRADATAGLGMVALLEGDADAARERLSDALAIHVVTRDAPREGAVRGMMMLLPESRTDVDEASLGAQIDALRASGQRWREALALGRLALAHRERGDELAAKARLAEARAAAGLASMSASSLALAIASGEAKAAGASKGPSIVVGREGRSLVLQGGVTHDLSRHGPVRRVLLALALAKLERPGAAMSTLDLVEAGWPGEKMRHEAATLRVYTTVRRLRGLGLSDALLTRDDGYLLDPEVDLSVDRG